MARRQKNDNDLLMEDELTAAFLDDATPTGIADEPAVAATPVAQTDEDDWDEELDDDWDDDDDLDDLDDDELEDEDWDDDDDEDD